MQNEKNIPELLILCVNQKEIYLHMSVKNLSTNTRVPYTKSDISRPIWNIFYLIQDIQMKHMYYFLSLNTIL